MTLVYLETIQKPRVDVLDNNGAVVCRAGELHVEESVVTGPFDHRELEKWVDHAKGEYGTEFQEWYILRDIPKDKTLVAVQNALKYNIEIVD